MFGFDADGLWAFDRLDRPKKGAAYRQLYLFGRCLGLYFVGVSLPVQTVLLTSAFLQKRATAVGVYNFLRYMGMTIGPMAGSLLLHLAGLPAAFGFAALLLVGCGWSGWWLGKAETSASR